MEYKRGPAPSSGNLFVRSSPTRTLTRKSTGCISAPRPPKKLNPLPRRKSAEYCYPSDSSLTPLSSSDDEDDASFVITAKRSRMQSPPPSGSVVLDSATVLGVTHLNDCSFGSIDQGISDDFPPRETNMESGDEPPATPPQDSGILIDPLRFELENSSTEIYGSVDDPMIGTSISAACLRSERVPTQSIPTSNHTKSLSAPVPPSCRKRKTRAYFDTRKRPSKQKKAELAEETTEEQMAIDTPAVTGPKARPGPAGTEPAYRSTVDTPSIPGLSRPALHNNPPIWAQVRVSR